MDENENIEERRQGTQSLHRAIDILEAVADGTVTLPDLAKRLGLSVPTCYRLATALSDRGLLAASPRSGYRIGPRLRDLADRTGGR